jgi:predicted dehydrogenase
VIGLGLVGQVAVALLKAQGCRVIGTDLDHAKCELALRMGAESASPHNNDRAVADFTKGRGADAVLIAASTKSNGPVEMAAEAVRAKGRIVAVGAVKMDLPRRPLYFKEAEFLVSCAYGPGRYDPDYEERGRDYPVAHVRWTAQRNMQAFLDLLSLGRLDVAPLITHRFAIHDAPLAYQLIANNSEPYLAIALSFPPIESAPRHKRVQLRVNEGRSQVGIGCLGAGNFARLVLLPALRRSKQLSPRLICSAGGLSAEHAASTLGFEAATADENEVFADPNLSALFVLTRHDQHASQVIRALQAGKHVFVEKPLALTIEELSEIERVLTSQANERVLMVGFNRRFSPSAHEVKQAFVGTTAPLTVSIRMNAGAIPPEHWTQQEESGGGRLIGEACHAIDLATFLTGSLPVRVFAESVGGPQAPTITDDQCFITLRHANGSISSIAYLAGGDRSFPKERVEVLGGGQMAVIEDFLEVVFSKNGRLKRKRLWRQDKGHQAEIDAFAQVLTQGGDAPISWEELRAVTLASILAVRSIREGVPLEIPLGVASGQYDLPDDVR